MKKFFVFTLAAVLGMVACTQERLSTADSANEKAGTVKFRLAVNRPVTKDPSYFNSIATALDGAASNALSIRSVASFHTTAGEHLSNDVFTTEASMPTLGKLEYVGESGEGPMSATDWSLQDKSGHEVYFPVGDDVRMDALFLAANGQGTVYGETLDDYNDTDTPIRYIEDGNISDYNQAMLSGWDSFEKANWFPVFSDENDYTKKAEFINVDTYHQMDLMYAVANEVEPNETRTVLFDHAQALVIFNLKITNAQEHHEKGTFESRAHAALLFVNPEYLLSTSPDKYVKDVLTKAGETPSEKKTAVKGIFDGNTGLIPEIVTLKTVGTFTVDNSRNTMTASWDLSKWGSLTDYWSAIYDGIGTDFSYMTMKNLDYWGTEAEKDLPNHPNKSVIDAVDQDDFKSLDFEVPLSEVIQDVKSGETYDNTKYVQVAEQLIPAQKTVNPWLLFTPNSGEQYFLKEVNLPRGYWEMGHVYIYNLSFAIPSTPSFTVNVTTYESDSFDL